MEFVPQDEIAKEVVRSLHRAGPACVRVIPVATGRSTLRLTEVGIHAGRWYDLSASATTSARLTRHRSRDCLSAGAKAQSPAPGARPGSTRSCRARVQFEGASTRAGLMGCRCGSCRPDIGEDIADEPSTALETLSAPSQLAACPFLGLLGDSDTQRPSQRACTGASQPTRRALSCHIKASTACPNGSWSVPDTTNLRPSKRPPSMSRRSPLSSARLEAQRHRVVDWRGRSLLSC